MKHSAPHSFIPTHQRLMAIGQLCIAFSLLLWYMFQPFMGEYFTLRSRMLLYEYVMGTSDPVKKRNGEEKKMERFAARFEQLPDHEKMLILTDYHQIQVYAKRSMLKKIMDGIHVFLLDIPPFEQAWIFFSITITILILLKVEGAKQAAWLLPLITIAFAIDNQLTGQTVSSPDLSLFPSENMLVSQYVDEPLSQSAPIQQKQLKKGWDRYLVEKWSTEKDQSENHQIEEAEFKFTLARLQLLSGQPKSEWMNVFYEKRHPLILMIFVAWNIVFALIVSRSK
ncbi:MAG: hypothetical protein ACH350_04270 [Parachlamydiaceae bacterium]